MTRFNELRELSAAILLPLILAIIFPLVSSKQSRSLDKTPPLRWPAECGTLINGLSTPSPMFPLYSGQNGIWELMQNGGKLNRMNWVYRVHLKTFTTHANTLEILKMPPFQDIAPVKIYDQGNHRGFEAKLSDEQICELYKLPMVCSHMKQIM
jgi:hypothetical protein